MILINPQLDQLAPELSFRFLAHTPASLEQFRNQLTALLSEVLWGIRSGSKAKILMGNFTPPLWNAAGLAESSLETSQARFVQDLNGQLTKICSTFPDALIFEVPSAATELGLDHWRDGRLEFLAKSP
jgi:hypothetical protein